MTRKFIILIPVFFYISILATVSQPIVNIIWISEIKNHDLSNRNDEMGKKITQKLFDLLELRCNNLCSEKKIDIRLTQINITSGANRQLQLDSLLLSENIKAENVHFIIESHYESSNRGFDITTRISRPDVNTTSHKIEHWTQEKLFTESIAKNVDDRMAIDPLAIKIADELHRLYNLPFKEIRWKIYAYFEAENKENKIILKSLTNAILNELKQNFLQVDEAADRPLATTFMELEMMPTGHENIRLIYLTLKSRNGEKIGATVEHRIRLNDDYEKPAERIAQKVNMELINSNN
jgi:hypothetical protein